MSKCNSIAKFYRQLGQIPFTTKLAFSNEKPSAKSIFGTGMSFIQ